MICTCETSTADLRGAVTLCRYFLSERVRQGDRVLDATCGNGNDTLLLARLVGETGKVWAFDIQPEALRATDSLLAGAGCSGWVELVEAGHERLDEFVEGPLRAAVFNLGFLPGGEKACTTLPETTITALAKAAELVAPGGLLLIALYPGHPGGREECNAVEAWATSLSPGMFNAWCHRQLNRSLSAPYLVLVERRGLHSI